MVINSYLSPSSLTCSKLTEPRIPAFAVGGDDPVTIYVKMKQLGPGDPHPIRHWDIQ